VEADFIYKRALSLFTNLKSSAGNQIYLDFTCNSVGKNFSGEKGKLSRTISSFHEAVHRKKARTFHFIGCISTPLWFLRKGFLHESVKTDSRCYHLIALWFHAQLLINN